MKHSFLISLLLFTFLGTQAQNSFHNLTAMGQEQPMTLKDCILYAIEHNPNLKSVKLDEQANTTQIKELFSMGLPQVNGSGQLSNNFALSEQLLPGEAFGQPGTTVPVKFGVANSMTANIELQQLLFSKSFFTGLEAAKASQSLVELNTFKTTEDLVYAIAQVYLQLQITEEQQTILNANIDRIDQLIDISQIQFEEGLIKKIDVDQLKVNRTNLLTELQNAQIGATQQLNLIKFYMGMPADRTMTIAEFVSEGDRYPLSEKLILNENTSLKLLNKQLELSDFEIKNIQAGYYPTVHAFVRYGWQGQTDRWFSKKAEHNVQWTPSGVIGLTLNIPIFDGFQKKHQISQVQIKQSQLVLNRQHLTNSVQMEFANANETLRQNKTLLSAQKENMQLAEELYSVTKLSYHEGVAPLTELLNAETSLKEAQTHYLTSLLQLNLAELDHMRASGQLASLIKTELPVKSN